MSEISDKYYSKNDLVVIAKEKKIPEKYFEDFIAFVEKYIKKMTDDAELGEEEIGTAAINFAVKYFDKFEVEIQKGHSKEWSHKYAESIEEHPHAFNDAYEVIKESNPAKAKEELKIHCRAMGGDELYINHFIYLMENGEALSYPDKQAKSYSAIYKEQIALGKPKVFAHKYAALKGSGEYSEYYCLWYAKSYDECIQKEKSKEYAQLYADKMGDYYSDYYGRYIEDEEIDSENHEFNERNILGYMNAWEYARQNNLEPFGKFIEYYENIYINSYYADDRDYSIDEKELDMDILRRSLEKFSIYKSKNEDN